MELIDKSAVVAEIERLMTPECGYSMNKLLDYIDTLEEVKEVNLEKEMSEYFVEHPDEFFSDKYKLFAKHFFELGFKAQKEK